jgi:hypothetical protein
VISRKGYIARGAFAGKRGIGDEPELVNNELSLDRPLVDTDLHEALVVPDSVESLEVLEDALALVGHVAKLMRAPLVVHVLDEVRSKVSDVHREEGGCGQGRTELISNSLVGGCILAEMKKEGRT